MSAVKQLKKLGIGIGVLTTFGLVAEVNTAQAASFRTTITSSEFASVSLGAEHLDKIVFDWSTDETTGLVTQNELNNWEIKLVDTSGSNFYTDIVVSNGVVQTIGDNNKSRTINFQFDFANDTFNDYDNDVNLAQRDTAIVGNNGATGQTFHVYNSNALLGLVDLGLGLQEYNNGDAQGVSLTVLPGDTQITTQAVPEPLTIVGTAIALGFGAFFKRRYHTATKES